MEDNLKRLISEICNMVLARIEGRAREILTEIDGNKSKLKLFISNKQKQQVAKNTALCDECREKKRDRK